MARAQPLTTIWLEQLLLRPLQRDDVDGLCEIMLGDVEMNWPRVPWDRANVEYVLDVRLRHYEDFRFGMYAVEVDGKLIGWSGTQVWRATDGSVELGCFLARSHWRMGLGRKLCTWSIEQVFAHTDIPEVFALTRRENAAGVGVAEKMGFVEVGTCEHYGFPATVWKMSRETFGGVRGA